MREDGKGVRRLGELLDYEVNLTSKGENEERLCGSIEVG